MLSICDCPSVRLQWGYFLAFVSRSANAERVWFHLLTFYLNMMLKWLMMLNLHIKELRSVCNFISDVHPLLQCNSSKWFSSALWHQSALTLQTQTSNIFFIYKHAPTVFLVYKEKIFWHDVIRMKEQKLSCLIEAVMCVQMLYYTLHI